MPHVCARTHIQWILLHCLWVALSVPCMFLSVCVSVWEKVHYWCNPARERWCRSKSVMREHGGHPPPNDRERDIEWDRGREKKAIYQLPSYSAPALPWSPPTCLLPPLSSPVLLLLLLSSTSSKHPWNCVTKTWFQINRLQRVMKDRRGYARQREWGGPEFPWRPHRTPASWTNACVSVCAYVCVRIQGFHRGRHHKIFFSSFFRLGNKEAFLLRKDVIRTIRKRTPTRHVVKHIAFWLFHTRFTAK